MSQLDQMKVSANQAVHLEVRAGIRPRANDEPCTECGHIWKPGERRHEWHHYLGYSRDHWFDAIVVCTTCHRRLHGVVTHCKNGHEFTDKNTHRRKNGTRECRACRRGRMKAKRTPTWWRARQARRNG